MVHIGNQWDSILFDEFKKQYYLKFREFLKREYANFTVYPHMNDIFNALKYTPPENIKVVIIGQDPYHQPKQAHGLCFSVQKGVKIPPSLMNIYKEIESDLEIPQANHGFLESWAKQGVLMLNNVLTVREGQPNSHKGMGWEILTDKVIEILNTNESPIVFLLWGANARAKAQIITNPKHLKLTAPHPSPLSAYNGFFGCKHFSKTNEFLLQNGLEPIDWEIK